MDRSAAEAILSALRASAQILPPANGCEPMAVVPSGFALQSLSGFRTSLDRVRQTIDLLTAEAFCAYWARFATEHSVVFADERVGKYTAVIDYHTPDCDPRFCQHVAVYQTEPSPEWQIWLGASGKSMTQVDFARFIEDNYIDVSEPAHADMIAMATNLNAKKSVEFASSTSLQTGEVQFVYQEKISGTADKRQGSIKIPEKFVIDVPVLLADVRVKVDARFRFRIEEGKLRVWYDLHRWEQAKTAAIRRASDQIRKAIPEAPFFLGAAR